MLGGLDRGGLDTGGLNTGGLDTGDLRAGELTRGGLMPGALLYRGTAYLTLECTGGADTWSACVKGSDAEPKLTRVR